MFNKYWGGFVKHLSQTLGALQSVAKFIAMIVMNSVTPKAAAKLELNNTLVA